MDTGRRAPRPTETVTAVDRDILAASFEVDRSLLQWSLKLTLRERLRAATRTARMLGRFRRAGPPAAG